MNEIKKKEGKTRSVTERSAVFCEKKNGRRPLCDSNNRPAVELFLMRRLHREAVTKLAAAYTPDVSRRRQFPLVRRPSAWKALSVST
jgi:hypothetical protein